MENFLFLESSFLYLFFLVSGLFLYFILGKKSYCSNIIINNFNKKVNSKFLLILIFILFVLLLANPVLKNYKQKEKKEWIDIVVVMDLSYSMKADDLKPNRLEASKSILSDFIDNVKTHRVWLVLFSRKPFVSIPLTFDYWILKESINNLSVNTVSNNNPELMWTNIWWALLMAGNLFKKEESLDREKVIILLTDWDANVWSDPKTVARFLWENNIKVFSIWIWWTSWAKIEVWWSFWGVLYQHIPPITPEKLIEISNITNAKAYFAYDNNSLENIFSDLDKLNKKDIEIYKTINYKYLSEYIILFLMFFIFIFYLINFYKVNTK